MHAIFTTLKTRTATLGVCLMMLSFCVSSVWAQNKDAGSYDRVVAASPVTGINAVAGQPSQAAFPSNHLNPFKPEATIRFDVNKSQRVRLSVFNELGQQVMLLVDGRLEAGQHEARLPAYGLSSGTYFVRLETHTGVVTRTVVLMK